MEKGSWGWCDGEVGNKQKAPIRQCDAEAIKGPVTVLDQRAVGNVKSFNAWQVTSITSKTLTSILSAVTSWNTETAIPPVLDFCEIIFLHCGNTAYTELIRITL